LTAEERERLLAFISKGKASARALLKARILLKADAGAQGEGWTDTGQSGEKERDMRSGC